MQPEQFPDHLANLVSAHRKMSGLTQSQLAELAGVGKTVIYDIEHAKPSVRLDTIIKVLNVLNIHIELAGPLMHTYRDIKNATC